MTHLYSIKSDTSYFDNSVINLKLVLWNVKNNLPNQPTFCRIIVSLLVKANISTHNSWKTYEKNSHSCRSLDTKSNE